MIFTSSLADPNIWLKSPTEKYVIQYYTYILGYVENIITLDKEPHKFMYMSMEKFTANN